MDKTTSEILRAAIVWYETRNGTRADQIVAEKSLTKAIEALRHRQGQAQPHPPA